MSGEDDKKMDASTAGDETQEKQAQEVEQPATESTNNNNDNNNDNNNNDNNDDGDGDGESQAQAGQDTSEATGTETKTETAATAPEAAQGSEGNGQAQDGKDENQKRTATDATMASEAPAMQQGQEGWLAGSHILLIAGVQHATLLSASSLFAALFPRYSLAIPLTFPPISSFSFFSSASSCPPRFFFLFQVTNFPPNEQRLQTTGTHSERHSCVASLVKQVRSRRHTHEHTNTRTHTHTHTHTHEHTRTHTNTNAK